MPTDSFVPASDDARVRNEPTLAPGVVIPPARGWWADRPGELRDGVQPHGPLFGSPGPNVGYALHLVHRLAPLQLASHESIDDAEAVVAALAMRRAASFGRAPVAGDVERAATLLGYRGGADPSFVAQRVDAVHDAHHDVHVCQHVTDSVPLEQLRNG